MHKRAPEKLIPALALALVAGSTALAGCSPGAHTLPRCFDQPYRTDHDKPASTNITVAYNAARKSFAGDPKHLGHAARQKVLDAIVQVTSPTKPSDGISMIKEGSGFMVSGKAGDTYVVTAAHVVVPAQISDLKVITANGESLTVSGGCYMFDDSDKNLPPSDNPPTISEHPELLNDLALLKVSKPLAGTTLSFAKTGAQRGDWGIFMNYEIPDHASDAFQPHPITFTGVYARTDAHDRVITGLDTWNKPDADNPTRLTGGGSGGVVVDTRGDVLGMSYAGSKAHSVSSEELSQEYAIDLAGSSQAPRNRYDPTAAYLMDAPIIQHALTSSKLS